MQDVINHAVRASAAGGESVSDVRRDWYTNYRPNTEAMLERWRVVHWMGVRKPWGQRGHTDAPLRYNDGLLTSLDQLWRDECHALASEVSKLDEVGGARNRSLHCGMPFRRRVPQRVDDSAYALGGAALTGLVVMRLGWRPCREKHGRSCALVAATSLMCAWAFAVYLVAEWDRSAAWLREAMHVPRAVGIRE